MQSRYSVCMEVFQEFPIHHDDVVGPGVDAVVQSLRAVLIQLLGGEGNEDCHTRGSQSPLNLNLIQPQGQAADHAFLLLIIQLGELTVVFLGNGIGLKNVQDRIHIAFGDQYGIEIASKLGCYTKIMVRIPITHRQSEENDPEHK